MSESKSSSGGGIGVFGLLGCIFVTLKLCGVISWSWWWVTSPFWVTLLLIILSMMWLIRRYVRRALALEQMHRGIVEHPNVGERSFEPVQHMPTLRALVQPLKEGVVDLRSVGKAQPAHMAEDTVEQVVPLTFGQFVNKYKLFFLFLMLVISIIVSVWMFFSSVLVSERTFQIQDVSQSDDTSEQVGPQQPTQ